MAEAVGQEEDKQAFLEWVEVWFRERLGYIGRFGPAWERYPTRTAELRTAFDAGLKRGIEKRGCLHPNCGECKRGEDGGG